MLPLTGTSHPEHMKQDLASLGIMLESDALKALEALAG
jgi:aryl-alcohol dehydrogenase-like predicted oxidoreductase